MSDAPETAPEAGGFAGDHGGERVPESWPPADPFEPVKPRRIHWLLAVPVAIPALLSPRRSGPHLAASSWTAAYVAHLFWALVAVGTLYALQVEELPLDAPSLRALFLANPGAEIQRGLAGAVLLFYMAVNTWTEAVIALAVTVVIELGFWAAGVLVVPLYATGEGARQTYFRCVKLLLWSSAFQAAIAWFYPRVIMALRMFDDVWMPAGALLLELWWLIIIFRLGARYGGPQTGPRWQDRQPRCEACGYSLVSLPLTGRCPECGRPVSKSLPQARRPTEFATARGLRSTPGAFVRTTWAALFARRFARRVAVWTHHGAARNYTLLVCSAVGAIAALTCLMTFLAEGRPSAPHWDPDVPRLFGELQFIPIAMLVGLGSGAGAVGWFLVVGLFLSRFGFRDVADRVVVLCYATAWLSVPLLLGIAGGWTAYGIIRCWGPLGRFYTPEIGLIEYAVAIWMACLAPGFVTFVLSFLRLRVLLRESRFANA